CFCFFFSSRRRHTRSKRDWSSDVCSSDLDRRFLRPPPAAAHGVVTGVDEDAIEPRAEGRFAGVGRRGAVDLEKRLLHGVLGVGEIGRASCRERGWVVGGGGIV